MSQKTSLSSFGWELKAIFSFGFIFVLIMILIAFILPQPSEFQHLIFRIVLALAASGIGALVPGLLTIRFKNFLRAGGALAIFAIVYFFNPATLVTSYSPKFSTLPTDLFRITFIYERQGKYLVNSYNFPISDIRKKNPGIEFFGLLENLPNLPEKSLSDSSVFRISDEQILTRDSDNVLKEGNLGVLIIPNSAIRKYGDPHLAFTHIYSQIRRNDRWKE